jgi:hypothetical protein
MTTPLARLRQDYAAAFLRYLFHRDEAARAAAYELGRLGLCSGISLLDVVQIHHDVLIEVLHSTEELQEVGNAAAAFLVETLAPFEMTNRGFMEQRDRRKPGPMPTE